MIGYAEDTGASLLEGKPKQLACARRSPLVLVAIVAVAGALALVLLGNSHMAPVATDGGNVGPSSRLRIVNGCDKPLWIASFAGAMPLRRMRRVALDNNMWSRRRPTQVGRYSRRGVSRRGLS